MVIKKFLLFVLTVSIFTVSGNALERKKLLPLKELQNLSNSRCSAIPYPQTDSEVITDLKYFIKNDIRNNKQNNSSGIYEPLVILKKKMF